MRNERGEIYKQHGVEKFYNKGGKNTDIYSLSDDIEYAETIMVRKHRYKKNAISAKLFEHAKEQ